MKTTGKELALFEDLTEFQLNNKLYDLHNDFTCFKIDFLNDKLLFHFKNSENTIMQILFYDVKLHNSNIDLIPTRDIDTIDIIYRGRYEKNGILIDEDDNQRVFIYCAFYGGKQFEFWSRGLEYQIAS